MRNATIIYNPSATGMNDETLKCMENILLKQDLKVKSLESKYPGNTIELVKKANEKSDLIFTMGGDGTLGEAFRAFGDINQKAYYAHMSVGTANDTADNLHLLKGNVYSSMKLYENLNNCAIVPVDLITANEIPFSYVSCCGTFTNLTYETPKSFKKQFGKTGYYMFSGLIGLSTIPDIVKRPLKISYDMNGKTRVTEAITMIVSNTKTFAGFKIFPKANISDGMFEVTVLRKAPGLKSAKLISELLYKDAQNFNPKAYEKYIDMFQTNNFKITFDSGEPKAGFNHDGDHTFVSLDDNNTIEYKIKKKVKMLLPKN